MTRLVSKVKVEICTPASPTDVATIIDDLKRAFAAEKSASLNTTLVVEKARAHGIPYKVLALGVAEHITDGTDENVVDRADRLAATFRKRASTLTARRRGISVHITTLGNGVLSTHDEAMTTPYGKPTYIREIFYDGNLPPGAEGPPQDHDENDHDLGRGQEDDDEDDE